VRLFARPELAIAAAFLLVLGGVMALRTTMSPRAESAAMAPAASATSAPGALALAPPPAAEPAGAAEVAATATASALALATPPLATAAGAHAKGAGRSDSNSDDTTLAPAMALFKAGRYAEALPKFDALASTNREAALYAARCVARTQGCSAAAPRFDAIARDGSGSDAGSRAALEIARCYKNAGQVAAARPRYEALTTDNYVSREAQTGLADLDAPRAAKPAAQPASPPPQATINVMH
jgi:hypothetical protein